MLEEYLRVTREVSAAQPCNPTALIGSILDIIPRNYPGGRFSVDGLHLVVSYSWDFQDGSTQELKSLVRRLNLVTTYSERRNSFARCKKRTCEALTIICFLALETFLPEYDYHYSLSGNHKFVLCNGLELM